MTKIDLSGGFCSFILTCTLSWKHTSVLFSVCRRSPAARREELERFYILKIVFFVCFNRYVVRRGALADCTFAFIYLDECLLRAEGTYNLVCSPMRWWVMCSGVAFRSVLMIHSSIREKTYLFLYWENIYFGQIVLKNRVLDEWLLLWCSRARSGPP